MKIRAAARVDLCGDQNLRRVRPESPRRDTLVDFHTGVDWISARFFARASGVGDVRALGIPPIFKDSATATHSAAHSAARRGAAVLGARAI